MIKIFTFYNTFGMKKVPVEIVKLNNNKYNLFLNCFY